MPAAIRSLKVAVDKLRAGWVLVSDGDGWHLDDDACQLSVSPVVIAALLEGNIVKRDTSVVKYTLSPDSPHAW